MAEGGPSQATAPPAEANHSFEGFDEEEGGEGEVGEGGLVGGDGRRRLFAKELRCMLYGYGDDKNPYTETVDFLEDLVHEFIGRFLGPPKSTNQHMQHAKLFHLSH